MDWAGFWAWVTSNPLSATLYGLAALVVIVGIIVFLFVKRKKEKVVVQNVSVPIVRVKEGVEIACPNCGEHLIWTQNGEK